MRKIYSERRRILQNAIERFCGDYCRVAGVGAGLHLVTHLTRSAPATKVIATARDAGIWLDEWQQFEARDKRTEGLVFGYGAIESTRIAEAVRRLSKLMK